MCSSAHSRHTNFQRLQNESQHIPADWHRDTASAIFWISSSALATRSETSDWCNRGCWDQVDPGCMATIQGRFVTGNHGQVQDMGKSSPFVFLSGLGSKGRIPTLQPKRSPAVRQSPPCDILKHWHAQTYHKHHNMERVPKPWISPSDIPFSVRMDCTVPPSSRGLPQSAPQNRFRDHAVQSRTIQSRNGFTGREWVTTGFTICFSPWDLVSQSESTMLIICSIQWNGMLNQSGIGKSRSMSPNLGFTSLVSIYISFKYVPKIPHAFFHRLFHPGPMISWSHLRLAQGLAHFVQLLLPQLAAFHQTLEMTALQPGKKRDGLNQGWSSDVMRLLDVYDYVYNVGTAMS